MFAKFAHFDFCFSPSMTWGRLPEQTIYIFMNGVAPWLATIDQITPLITVKWASKFTERKKRKQFLEFLETPVFQGAFNVPLWYLVIHVFPRRCSARMAELLLGFNSWNLQVMSQWVMTCRCRGFGPQKDDESEWIWQVWAALPRRRIPVGQVQCWADFGLNAAWRMRCQQVN